MEKLEKLENDIQSLNKDELAVFRNWFIQYDSDAWDREIEEDIHGGKLDNLAREAIAAYNAGRSKEI
ncbi:MAG: hypothetical protein R6W90_15470 [Ignavibacteriaceae bacterium]